MKRLVMGVGILALLLLGDRRADAGPIGYSLDVSTFFQAGSPPDLVGGGSSGTPTGYFRVTNNGLSTFSGTIGVLAFSGAGGNLSFLTSTTLAPGQSASVGLGPDSSKVGGINGPTGSTQTGAEIALLGTVTSAAGSESVNLIVADKDIHSGVFHTNPFGVSVDNYVLQGGDPQGRPTGDAFAEGQASGGFAFSEAVATPEPASAALLAIGAVRAASSLWRRRKKA